MSSGWWKRGKGGEEGKKWKKLTYPRSRAFAEEKAAPYLPNQGPHRLPGLWEGQEGPPNQAGPSLSTTASENGH